VIQEGTRHKSVAVATVDGGANWTQSPLDDEPISLFFLNDSLGWMVTEKGIWRTSEAGRDWTRRSRPPAPPLRVWFWDENHGIAACAKKTVLETFDGGKKWTPIAEAAKPAGAPSAPPTPGSRSDTEIRPGQRLQSARQPLVLHVSHMARSGGRA
jgi:photosystem II stability/assembly factor-like uncharacterized protein